MHNKGDSHENAFGLRYLFEALNLKADYRSVRDTEHVRLGRHPFNLDDGIQGRIFGDTFLIAYPGYAERSLHNMALMLQHEAMKVGTEDFKRQLRVVRIPVCRRRTDHKHNFHDLYFEIITNEGTFMCGGCNNYSGTGIEMGKKLESMFATFSHLWGEKVRYVTLRVDHEVTFRALSEAYNLYKRSRRLL